MFLQDNPFLTPQQEGKKGIGASYATAISAYVIWGTLILFWGFLDTVSPLTVFCHRIVWGALFFAPFALIPQTSRTHLFRPFKEAVIRSLLLGANWYLLVWAVSNDYILNIGLGYFITPFSNILFGIFLLKEKPAPLQIIALLVALAGVIWHIIATGVIPSTAMVIAVAFGTYGYTKKISSTPSMPAIFEETSLLAVPSLIYLLIAGGFPLAFDPPYLLIAAGPLSAIPLLLFAVAVTGIPLFKMGLLQFITPSIMILIGIFFKGEAFTFELKITFSFIWTALLLYFSAQLKENTRVIKT